MRVTIKQLKSLISEAVRTAHVPSVKNHKSELARLKKIIKEEVEKAVEDAVQEGEKRPLAIVYTNPDRSGAAMLTKGTSPVITNMALSELNSNEPHKTLDDPKVRHWVESKLLPELKTKGVLEYMTVLQKKDNQYYVVDGNHRLVAYKAFMEEQGNKEDLEVPVWVLPSDRVIFTDWIPGAGTDPAEKYKEFITK